MTRALTEEDKAMMEVPFVGRNGEKRKIEVSDDTLYLFCRNLTHLLLEYHGTSKTEEESPV